MSQRMTVPITNPAPTGTPGIDVTAEPSEPPAVTDSPVPTGTSDVTVTPTPDGGNDNGKILAAYFSWSGTSERIAQNIISQTASGNMTAFMGRLFYS